ncbi:MAG TPA: hypothetical protein VE404_07730 [Verrucomicrobiae bacterium]|nr:hypothetical protein [Verrucomicrobiae bacterium]
MTELTALWPPILLSSVIVFVVSTIIHMALPGWHKNDCLKLPNEDRFADAVRPLAIPPGPYMVPRADSHREMGSPEFQEKLKRGPVMLLTVLPNAMKSMGTSLSLWFAYSIVVALFSAYITGRALPPGSNYLHVFRFVGTSAFLSYAVAGWQESIWWGRPWTVTAKHSLDGLVYALFTAGTFGWLWPR